MSDKLEPLVEGVKRNKEHWLEIAAAQKLTPATNHDRENAEDPYSIRNDSKSSSQNNHSTEFKPNAENKKMHNNCTPLIKPHNHVTPSN